MGTILEGIPVEAHEKIGAVEGRQKVVRTIYGKLSRDLPLAAREYRLPLTFRAINEVRDRVTGSCPTSMVSKV